MDAYAVRTQHSRYCGSSFIQVLLCRHWSTFDPRLQRGARAPGALLLAGAKAKIAHTAGCVLFFVLYAYLIERGSTCCLSPPELGPGFLLLSFLQDMWHCAVQGGRRPF